MNIHIDRASYEDPVTPGEFGQASALAISNVLQVYHSKAMGEALHVVKEELMVW